MKILKQKKGFTLVELLVAMTIFVAFIGILIGSYTSIVRAQRDANEYRIMYSEARQVFETLVFNLREGMVDYAAYTGSVVSGQPLSELTLISKDALRRTKIIYNGETKKVSIKQGFLPPNTRPCINAVYPFDEPVDLNSSELKVTDFKVYVAPIIDPYALENFDKHGNQFHPFVTIFAEFTREYPGGKEPFVINLQTTVSSRIYNQIYSTDINECQLYS